MTFFSLVFLGVMSISSYSILFVRDHLLNTSRDSLDRQAHFLAQLLRDQEDESKYPEMLGEYARYTGRKVEILDPDFKVYMKAGELMDSSGNTFTGVAPLAEATTENRFYVRISNSEGEIRATLRKVRYIIYGGIFISLFLTIIISWMVADRITLPIRTLAESANKIASGESVLLPKIDRKDEIGDLGRAVADMANRLQTDISDLKRLNQAQEDFIAALSHELRNPIFSARGYLEAAIDELGESGTDNGDNHAVLGYLDKSHRNLLRIHNLFADMLMLVKLQFDQEPVPMKPISLSSILHEMEETFAPQAADRELALTVADSNATVQARAELIKIALSNLLSNAVRHTEKGSVALSVKEVDDGKIRLAVTDTGSGIPKDQLSRIFERFYRVDKARSREQGGAGLGLALVSQCMESLETEINVTSEEGVGSTFWFDLPRV